MDKENKKLDIRPMKLTPPPEAVNRIMNNDKKRNTGNPITNFFKTFLGEGF